MVPVFAPVYIDVVVKLKGARWLWLAVEFMR